MLSYFYYIYPTSFLFTNNLLCTHVMWLPVDQSLPYHNLHVQRCQLYLYFTPVLIYIALYSLILFSSIYVSFLSLLYLLHRVNINYTLSHSIHSYNTFILSHIISSWHVIPLHILMHTHPYTIPYNNIWNTLSAHSCITRHYVKCNPIYHIYIHGQRDPHTTHTHSFAHNLPSLDPICPVTAAITLSHSPLHSCIFFIPSKSSQAVFYVWNLSPHSL